jgi:taurine dioxygenase
LEVTGFDVSGHLDQAMMSEIIELLYRYAVVCFRDQRVPPDSLEKFARRFGKPIQHIEENLRLQGLPTVMSLSNADDRDERQLNGGAHWHTDLIHTREPASFTMLHAIAVPDSGGGTFFANQVAAYDALAASVQEKINELEVIHCYEGRTDGSMPETVHPLVRKHPVTGRKALYGAADTGIGIVGMPQEEARNVYAGIGAHATQDRFVYLHRYRINDIVIWDNAQLLHSAEVLQRATLASQKRIMHRVSVRGWP